VGSVPAPSAGEVELDACLVRRVMGRKTWGSGELLTALSQAADFKRLTQPRRDRLQKLLQQAARRGLVDKQGRGTEQQLRLSFHRFNELDREAFDQLLLGSMRKNQMLERDTVYRKLLDQSGFPRSSTAKRAAFDKHLRSAMRRKLVQRVGQDIQRV